MTSDPHRPAVGPAALALGFSGLLPQAAVVLLALTDGGGLMPRSAWPVLALIYGGAILSFLGGIWWGFAMRRREGQGTLAALSVLPSLVAAALLCGLIAIDPGWLLVALGSAILLTLPVDRRLAATGEAPEGWMRLRVPLSVGLGGLTILAGALAG